MSENIVLNADTFRNLDCIDIKNDNKIITVYFSIKYIHFPAFNKKEIKLFNKKCIGDRAYIYRIIKKLCWYAEILWTEPAWLRLEQKNLAIKKNWYFTQTIALFNYLKCNKI